MSRNTSNLQSSHAAMEQKGGPSKKLGQFRRALRKPDQELFDELFERAHLHAQAAVQVSSQDSMESIIISMLIEMLREENNLRERIDKLERELTNRK